MIPILNYKENPDFNIVSNFVLENVVIDKKFCVISGYTESLAELVKSFDFLYQVQKFNRVINTKDITDNDCDIIEINTEKVLQNKYKVIDTVYKDKKNVEFKSYREWKKEGYQVRKGEKAFLLWGRPKEHQIDEDKNKTEITNKEPMDENHDPYFPVAYVFSNAQVDLREHQLEHEEEKTMSELSSIRTKEVRKDNELER